MGANCGGCGENTKGTQLIDTDSLSRNGKSRLTLVKEKISASVMNTIFATGLNTMLTSEEITSFYSTRNYLSTKITSDATLKVNIDEASPLGGIVKGYHKLVRNQTPFALYLSKNDTNIIADIDRNIDELETGLSEITVPSKDTTLFSNRMKYIAPYQSVWILSQDTIQLLFKITNI